MGLEIYGGTAAWQVALNAKELANATLPVFDCAMDVPR
jgi:hypothetical protein